MSESVQSIVDAHLDQLAGSRMMRRQGVTAPLGFRAAGITAGLKPSGKSDLALVFNERRFEEKGFSSDFESLIGRRLKEEGRRCVIALDAAAMRIHPSQVVLRHHVAQACAVAIQGRSQNLVAYNAFTMLVSNRPKAQAHTC